MRTVLLCGIFFPAIAVAGDATPSSNGTVPPTPTTRLATAHDPTASNGIPSGDGSRIGMGGDLATVEPATGVARSSFTFDVPGPRGGLSLKVGLHYASTVGDSDAGVGWSFTPPSIERRSGSGTAHPKYNDPPVGQPIHASIGDLNSQDEFVYGGVPITPICFIGNGGEGACGDNAIPDFAKTGGWHLYRLLADQGQDLRLFWSPDHQSWVLIQKSGEVRELGVPLDERAKSLLGRTRDMELLPPPRNAAPYRWKLARQYDAHRGADGAPSNVVYYVWDSERALTDIFHTGRPGFTDPWQQGFAHHIHFNYSYYYEFPRPASRPDHIEWRNTPLKRLVGVDVTSAEGSGPRELTRRYHLSYKSEWHHSYLVGIQQEGRCNQTVSERADFTLPETDCPRLPPRTMTYTRTDPRYTGFSSLGEIEYPEMVRYARPIIADLNSDGLPDLYKPNQPEQDAEHAIYLSTGSEPPFIKRIMALDPQKNAAHHGYLEQVYGNFGDLNLAASGVAKMVRFGGTGWYFGNGQPIPHGGHSPTENTTFFAYYPAKNLDGAWFWLGGPQFEVHYPEHPSVATLATADIDGDGFLDKLNYAYSIEAGGEGGTFIFKGLGLNRTEKFPESVSHRLSKVSYYGLQPNAEYNGAELAGQCADSIVERKMSESHERFKNGNPDSVPPLLVADMDGDALLDLVEFEDNWSDPAIWYWPGRGEMYFGKDVCVGNENSGLECRCGNGAPVKMPIGGGPWVPDPHHDRFFFRDVTGDGLADMIRPVDNVLRIWANVDGGRWTPGHDIDMSTFPGWDANKTSILFGDMVGVGTESIVVVQHGANKAAVAFVDLTGSTKGGLLETIRGEHGSEVLLTYQSIQRAQVSAEESGRPWRTHSPQTAQVVNNVWMTNRSAPTDSVQHIAYEYRDPFFDAHNRIFRGFRFVSITQFGDDKFPSMRTDTTYAYGNCLSQEHWFCNDATDDLVEAIHGLPVLTETRSLGKSGGAGDTFPYQSTAHRTYDLSPLHPSIGTKPSLLLTLRQEDIWLYDIAGASQTVDVDELYLPGGFDTIVRKVNVRSTNGTRHLKTSVSTDRHGNESERIEWGQVDGAADPGIRVHTNWKDVGAPSVPGVYRPTDRSVIYMTGQVGPPRMTYYAHNAAGDLTDVSGDLDGTLPLLRHHEDAGRDIAPAPANASAPGRHSIKLAHFDTDAYGNVVHVEEPGGRCRDMHYDESYSDLLVNSVVYTNGCGGHALTTFTKFDRGLGKPRMVVGPDGGTSSTEYDAFGRTFRAFQPHPDLPGASSSSPSLVVEYIDDPNGQRVHSKVQRSAAGAYQDQWQYIDSIGNPIVTLEAADPAAGDGGQWVLGGWTERTFTGRPVRMYRAEFYNGDAANFDAKNYHSTQSFERVEYDDFGRVAMQYALDGTPAAKFEYYPLRTTTWDAEDLDANSAHRGTPITVLTDGYGRTIETQEAYRTTSGELKGRSTSFKYLATGEVSKVTRGGEVASSGLYARTLIYDTLGRLVENLEPNSGTWRYAYNDAGDLVGTSDARGCGKNIVYDGAGRPLAEDFSPCLKTHTFYSTPELSTGHGTEVFWVYDRAEAGDPTPNLGAESRLTALYDRGAHTRIYYDGRGRTTGIARQIGKPGFAKSHLDERYGQHWFKKNFAYADDNSLIGESTGADIEGLLAEDGTSSVRATYSLRGLATGISSSYGAIITKATHDFDGQPLAIQYGDAANTKADFNYDGLRRPRQSSLSRTAPELWTNPPPFYEAPERAETAQLSLQHDVFTYDRSDNLVRLDDLRDPTEWPEGAKPVKRDVSYDALYRVTQVDYDSQGDTFSPPLAQGLGRVDNAVPYTTTPKRIQQQTFEYDTQDNLTKSTDDAHLLFDRSLGTIKHKTDHPNQVSEAGPRADGSGADFVSAAYDAAGNVGALSLQRTAAECAHIDGCTQHLAYDWDEVGQLARARRWDFRGEYSPDIVYPNVPDAYPDADLTLAYDGNGQRVRKEIKEFAGPTEYAIEIFDSLRLDHASWNDVREDYERSSDTQTAYLVLGGTSFGRIIYDWRTLPSPTNSHQHVFLQIGDHLGSTSTVIDKETGELVEKSTYQAYGAAETDYRPERWESFREHYRFTGKEDDVQVGLTYFGARYYSAALGRFTSPDPLSVHSLGASLNPYAYVTGDVFGSFDPLGLEGAPWWGVEVENWPGGFVTWFDVFTGNIEINTPGMADKPTKEPLAPKWTAPRVTSYGDIRWNPISNNTTNTMLMGAPQEPTLSDTNPELAQTLHDYGPTAISLVPYAGAAIDVNTLTDPTASTTDRVLAGIGVAAAVIPGAKFLTNGAKNALKVGKYGALKAAGAKDAHHIIQDAAVRELQKYSHSAAPATTLRGPSTAVGTPHWAATQVQRQAGGGTYAAERRIGYKALRRGGIGPEDARQLIEEADRYFNSIGVGPATVTRIPGNR